MVREIALDLEQMRRLELEQQVISQENVLLGGLVKDLEQKDLHRQLQLGLLKENLAQYQSQLQIELASPQAEHWSLWALRLFGGLAAGFVLGRL